MKYIYTFYLIHIYFKTNHPISLLVPTLEHPRKYAFLYSYFIDASLQRPRSIALQSAISMKLLSKSQVCWYQKFIRKRDREQGAKAFVIHTFSLSHKYISLPSCTAATSKACLRCDPEAVRPMLSKAVFTFQLFFVFRNGMPLA